MQLLGPLEVDVGGRVAVIARPKERAVLTMLALRAGEPVSEDTLVDALWGDAPPRTATKTLRSHISRLRGALAPSEGAIAIDTTPRGYRLACPPETIDAVRAVRLLRDGRDAALRGDHAGAAASFAEARRLWRGRPIDEFADEPWARADTARFDALHDLIIEEWVDAELACGRHAALLPELEARTRAHPLRERLWMQRMLALYRCGRQAEALRVYHELRTTLSTEIGIEPSTEAQALERAILAQDESLRWQAARRETPPPAAGLPTGVVTFLLTDIVDSTALWEKHLGAMAEALREHDTLVARTVHAHDGVLMKSKGEGDSTLSVFQRATDAVHAALALRSALAAAPWPAGIAVQVRVALHTGEAFEREGDYFGPALNRAARLRSLAGGDAVVLSESTASLVRDSLPAGVSLVDFGTHALRGLSRAERVFALGDGDDHATRIATIDLVPRARAFRFEPPALRTSSILRPRLLRTLQQRWQYPVTVVTAGAGLGKTTLLAQAIHENRMDPRGIDVWLGLERGETAARIADDLLVGLRNAAPRGATAASVGETLWECAPTPVCLVFDDVHLLPPRSDAATFLASLVEALPSNGHVLLAGRAQAVLPLARMAASGRVVRLTDADLRFDDAELARAADAHGVDRATLAASGGWPALAELAAAAGRALSLEYVWEEVIEPLGHEGRRVLGALVDLGGADEDLLSAALGTPVDLHHTLSAVPLVDVTADGWYRPHALWREISSLRLDPGERRDIHSRAGRHLTERGRLDDAFTVVADAELWEETSAILRAACLDVRRPSPDRLRAWLDATPASVRESPCGRLASGVVATMTRPRDAAPPLRAAIAAFAASGDLDAELGAMAHLGRIAWWSSDLGILGELYARLGELAENGHPTATPLLALGRAVFADLVGDEDAAAAALDAFSDDDLPVILRASAAWLRANAHYNRGDLAQARATASAALDSIDDPEFAVVLETVLDSIDWIEGVVVERPPASRPAPVGGGPPIATHNLTIAVAAWAYRQAMLGHVDDARRALEEARSTAAVEQPFAIVRIALATAAILVADGDDETAARVLAETTERHPLLGAARRAWRQAMCLTYVLLPEARKEWDAATLSGCWREVRDLARAVVTVREHGPAAHVAIADLGPPAAVRARLHFRFAAELAVALHASGRAEAAALLDHLGLPGRRAVRELADRDPAWRTAARALTVAVPATPPVSVRLEVLGPFGVRHDGVPLDAPAFRRERVRSLLAYLLVHPLTTRAATAAALWPDLDERSAANNLRVTLTHLSKALEPWRVSADRTYFVRSDGPELQLVRGDFLRIDLDEFERHLDAADASDRDGLPSLALEHLRTALDLWRGDPFVDVPEFGWLESTRRTLRSRCAAALQRAGQLNFGRGDIEQAERLARRALTIDGRAEAAHTLLVAVGLARQDRAAAQTALDDARAALAGGGRALGEQLTLLARQLTTS